MTPAAEQRIRAACAALADALIAAEQSAAAAEGPDRLYSVPEAAARLGIGRTALYRALGSGRIRSVRVGRRRLIPSSAIAALINETAPGRTATPRALPLPAAIDADRPSVLRSHRRAKRAVA